MSFIKPIATALVITVALGVASKAAAEDITVENCTVLKVEESVIWIVGPCERPAAFEVAPKATITVDGRAVRLSDLPAGLIVKLTIRAVNNSLIVEAVDGRTE